MVSGGRMVRVWAGRGTGRGAGGSVGKFSLWTLTQNLDKHGMTHEILLDVRKSF